MKKRIFIILAAISLLLTACSNPQISLPTDSEDSALLLEEYLGNPEVMHTPIREYGENTGTIQMEEDLVVRILYPEGEIAALNTALADWTADTIAYYQSEAAGSSKSGDSAELTADYDSYLLNDEWVSVKITGLFDKPYLAHPIDVIGTFHANLKTGKLISLDDILLENGSELLQNMVIKDAALNIEDIDEHLLDLWALTADGLEIILERGDYLPMSAGTITLRYSPEDLTDILDLSKASATPEPQPTPEITPTPDPSLPEETPSATPDVPDSATIDPNKPMVALTFDDGPSKHTDRLLDTFATNGGKGTFFLVGNIIDSRQDTVKRMATEGHEIAGHSWSHRQLTKLTSEDVTDQIMSTKAKIYEVTGISTTIIRPPYGSYNDEVKRICADLGITMVNWSIDTLDWDHKDTDRIYNTILNDVKDGDIILCHDLYSSTVDAMERVIPELIAQGYQLVTVSELLSYSSKEVVAGNVYHKK